MIHSIDLTTSWAHTQHFTVPPVYACNTDLGAIGAGTG
jgi:hypothetical protein